jgi:hypothetical protein
MNLKQVSRISSYSSYSHEESMSCEGPDQLMLIAEQHSVSLAFDSQYGDNVLLSMSRAEAQSIGSDLRKLVTGPGRLIEQKHRDGTNTFRADESGQLQLRICITSYGDPYAEVIRFEVLEKSGCEVLCIDLCPSTAFQLAIDLSAKEGD